MQRGWCSRQTCPCWTVKVKRACPEWMGYSKGNGPYRANDIETWPVRYCPLCGWERADHRPLIHNGRKP